MVIPAAVSLVDDRVYGEVARVALVGPSVVADEMGTASIVFDDIPDGLHPPGCVFAGSRHGFLSGTGISGTYKKPQMTRS